MPASRASRRGLAIKRRQTLSSRESFLIDVRNSLPRGALRDETSWQAGRRSIELSIEADRWLTSHGYDRSGLPIAPGAR
jgi:hypothetical protein